MEIDIIKMSVDHAIQSTDMMDRTVQMMGDVDAKIIERQIMFEIEWIRRHLEVIKTEIDVTFSEALNAASVANADFTVTSPAFTLSATPPGVSGGVVTLTLTTNMGTGDRPTITIVGSVEDLATPTKNAQTTGNVQADDGLPPEVTSLTRSDDLVNDALNFHSDVF